MKRKFAKRTAVCMAAVLVSPIVHSDHVQTTVYYNYTVSQTVAFDTFEDACESFIPENAGGTDTRFYEFVPDGGDYPGREGVQTVVGDRCFSVVRRENGAVATAVDRTSVIIDVTQAVAHTQCEILHESNTEFQIDFFEYEDYQRDASDWQCVSGCTSIDVAITVDQIYEPDPLVSGQYRVQGYRTHGTVSPGPTDCGVPIEQYLPTMNQSDQVPGVDYPSPPEDPNCTADYYTDFNGVTVCGTPGNVSPPTDTGTTTSGGTGSTTGGDTGTTTGGSTGTTTAGTSGTTTSGETGSTGSTSGGTTSGGDTGSSGNATSGTDTSGDNGTDDDDDDDDEPNRSASGGDNCDVPPQCDGDPIDCAIVAQSWLARCQSEIPTESVILEQTGLSDVGGVDSITEETDILENISNGGAWDQTGFGGSAQCPPPVTINVLGGSVDIEYDHICSFVTLLRPFVLLVGGLMAFTIVIGIF